MLKKHKGLVIACVIGLAAGIYFGPTLVGSLSAPVEYTGHANAVDQSQSIAELAESADLIVQARVITRKNRIITEILPVYAEDAVTVLETRPIRTPFTDVQFEVLDTLKGGSRRVITVLQNGGVLKREPMGRSQNFALANDPLFEVDTDHFLFLVDITGDGVHSKHGRQLYRAVNAMGRYEILADGSLRGPDTYETLEPVIGAGLPRQEEELRDQVSRALPGV